MYKAYGLLRQDTDFDLDAAAARLAARIPGSSASRAGHVATVTKGDWSIHLADVAGPQVADETQGIVDKLAGLDQADAEALVASGRRVEVWTDDPDPFMEHFDDYLSAVEVLKSFGGLLAVDPREPGVL